MIDPFGDGDEHSSNAILASDGDPDTAWRSENYFDGVLGKPGVGLVLDLGRTREVLGLRLAIQGAALAAGGPVGNASGLERARTRDRVLSGARVDLVVVVSENPAEPRL